jgi:homogentisate 1,2-dioxygenase
VPGGGSLHNCMSGHGPDAATFEKASRIDTSTRTRSTTPWPSCSRPATSFARPARPTAPTLQRDYQDCWLGIEKNFNPERDEPA